MAIRPALYQLGESSRTLSLVGAILLVGFLLTAGYSASGVRPSASPLAYGQLAGTNTVVLHSNLTVSNPGLYPLSGLVVQAQLRLGGPSGALVATGASAATSVPGRTVAKVAFDITVPFGSGLPTSLLTQDATLAGWFWANATYAGLFGVHLLLPENLSWGAPFYGLAVHVGTPASQPNGSLAFPVTVAFVNHASFPLDGQVTYTLENTSGGVCGTGTIPVDAPVGSEFQQGSTTSVAGTCDPRGGTILVAFTGDSWMLSLPSEALP